MSVGTYWRWFAMIFLAAFLGASGAVAARKLRDAGRPIVPLHQVRVLADQGQWEQADQAVERWLVRRPGDGDTLLLAARIAAARERIERCIELLQQVPANSPQWPEAQLRLGQAYLGSGQARRAEQTFRAIIAEERHSSPDPARMLTARAELASILHLEQRVEEAVAVTWAMYPDHSEKWRLLVNLARMKNQSPHPNLSIPTLESFLEQDPNDLYARRALARYRLILMEWPEAEKQARLALQVAPNDSAAREYLLEALLAQQDWDSMDRILGEISASEKRAGLWRLRAQRSEVLGRFADAVHDFARAVELEPSDGTAHFQFARVLRLHGDADRADEHQRRHQSLKEHQGAIDSFLKNFPLSDSPQWRPPALEDCVAMSVHCEGLGRLPDARAWAELARSMNVNHSEVAERCRRLQSVRWPFEATEGAAAM